MPEETKSTPDKASIPRSQRGKSQRLPAEFTISGRDLIEEQQRIEDGNPIPQEAAAAEGAEFPCSVNGIFAGLSGGAMGYVWGFGNATISFLIFKTHLLLPVPCSDYCNGRFETVNRQQSFSAQRPWQVSSLCAGRARVCKGSFFNTKQMFYLVHQSTHNPAKLVFIFADFCSNGRDLCCSQLFCQANSAKGRW